MVGYHPCCQALAAAQWQASAAADPCSKALLGLTNYLHCRDYLFKGQNSTHPSGCGRKGSCNLSVLAIIWGVSSSSSINAHSWNLSGVLTHKELLQVLRKLPCQCAFSAVYLTLCAFPWVFCFLAARLRVPSGGFPGEPVLCMGGMSGSVLVGPPWAGDECLAQLSAGVSESARTTTGR